MQTGCLPDNKCMTLLKYSTGHCGSYLESKSLVLAPGNPRGGRNHPPPRPAGPGDPVGNAPWQNLSSFPGPGGGKGDSGPLGRGVCLFLLFEGGGLGGNKVRYIECPVGVTKAYKFIGCRGHDRHENIYMYLY